MKYLKIILIFSLLPLIANARGSLHLDAIFYIGLLFLAIVIWYNLWLYALGIPYFIFDLIFKLIGKNVRSDLMIFGCGGFWFTYGIPLIFISKEYPDLKWYYHFSLSAMCGLFFWFCVVYFLNYKEESWSKKD